MKNANEMKGKNTYTNASQSWEAEIETELRGRCSLPQTTHCESSSLLFTFLFLPSFPESNILSNPMDRMATSGRNML